MVNFTMKKVLIDNGSSTNIIFLDTLRKMGLQHDKLSRVVTTLNGFGGGQVVPMVMITLATSMGNYPKCRMNQLDYLVVDISFAYNIILG